MEFCPAEEIDALCRSFGRHSLFSKVRSLLYEIPEVSLKSGYQCCALEGCAVARQIRVEIQFFQRFERCDPFIELCIAHICDLRLHQIAGADDLLFW